MRLEFSYTQARVHACVHTHTHTHTHQLTHPPTHPPTPTHLNLARSAQAPPALKSWVMAVYLCSVSAGNLLTALVNAAWPADATDVQVV